jgi:geranylgeranyl pyrophosphate synthase
MSTATIPSVSEFEFILGRGGERLRRRMTEAEVRLLEVAREGEGPLGQHAGATIAAGGKRLRPLLVFLSAEATSGTGALGAQGELELRRAAVAIELVHNATLVHDDVLDAASLRRGRPTVVAAAGRPMAIAAGDLLFSRAFAELAENSTSEQLAALSRASSALADGELLQREDAYSPTVTETRYLYRCELKTARLFEAACRLGALAGSRLDAEPSSELVAGLGAYARDVGMAFQMLDDVLDVAGPAGRTGKHRGTDLLDGTVTLPLILARAQDPTLAALDLRTLAGAAAAEAVCDRIVATGALEEARRRALTLAAAAKAQLPRVLSEQRRSLLYLVADAMVERYS